MYNKGMLGQGRDPAGVPPSQAPGEPLTLVLLAAAAVADTVQSVQAGAVGSFTLVLTVAVGLSSHRDGARDGGRQGGKLRLRVRVTVLLGRTGNGHCWASLGVGAGLAQLREGYAGTSSRSCHVLACHTGRLCPWNYPALGHGWCLLSCRDLSALCGAGMFFVPAGDKELSQQGHKSGIHTF